MDVDIGKYFECGQCKNVYFCGKKCQVAVWKQHKTICQSIFTLNKGHQQNVIKRECYANDLSMKEKSMVATLIGDTSLMDCEIGGVPSPALLDRGQQVSNVSEKQLKNELNDHLTTDNERYIRGTR